MTTEERRQAVADVLASHQPSWADHRHPGAIICSCGVVLHRADSNSMRPWADFWRHVADQVLSTHASTEKEGKN